MNEHHICEICNLLFKEENTEIIDGYLVCRNCASDIRKQGFGVSDCCWADVYVYNPQQSMNPEANIKDPVECCQACHRPCDEIHISWEEMQRFRDTGEQEFIDD